MLGLPAKRRPLAPLSELENVNISMESDSASLTAFQGSQDDTSSSFFMCHNIAPSDFVPEVLCMFNQSFEFVSGFLAPFLGYEGSRL